MAVQPVIMPKLGAYTEDVLLAGWLSEEGAEVTVGSVVLEMETDKTTAEVAAETSGWLHQLVAAGDKVPIGTRVGLVAETREEYEALLVAGTGSTEPAAPDDAASNPFLGYINQGGVEAIAAVALAGRSGHEPSPPEPFPPATGRREGQLVSPRARALLRRLGFSLDQAREITGSGSGGRVTDRDVAAWAEAQPAGDQPVERRGVKSVTVQRTIPLRGRRGTIANRMVSSLQLSAQLTSILELDVKPLVELRASLNEQGATPRIGITSIVVKLVAHALREHPLLNSRVTETDIELLTEINVAVAVDTPDGLVAPVVGAADRLSLEEINRRITDLAARARDGSLTPDDMDRRDVHGFQRRHLPRRHHDGDPQPTPERHPLDRPHPRPPVVVGDGAIAVRPTMQACLTFDHRAVDGGPAAAFLATFEALVAALPELPS